MPWINDTNACVVFHDALGVRGISSGPFPFALLALSQLENLTAIYPVDIRTAMAANHRAYRRITAGLHRC
jgi:hypothetical protein